MIGLGLGLDRAGFAPFNYFKGLPSFVKDEYSLAFSAEGAEKFQDYDTDILYFRDSSFNRVAATFSRTSDATRINKQGVRELVSTGIPRIDYTDGNAKLLMEPARTNLFLNSDAPVTQTITVVSGTTYTVWMEGSGSIVLSGASTLTVTEATPRTFAASSTSLTCTISGSVTIAQVEAGSYPTSYIPTAGSAVTRNADTAVATGISANIGQSEGTVYNEILIKQPVGLGSQIYFSINIGAGLFLNCVINNAGRVLYDFYVNGSYTFSIFPATILTAGRHKIAVGYKAGDYALYVDGVLLGTSSNATAYSTTKDRVNIGNSLYGGNETVILFPTRLTNSELQQLTS